MKNLSKVLLLATSVALFASCSSNNNRQQYANQPNNVEVQPEQVAGFNVPAFAELLSGTTNLQLLEQSINTNGNAINNMDLDGDGNIDYLNVVENGKAVQVVDAIAPDNTVVVATINITGTGNNGQLAIQGNQAYCGPHYYHTSAFTNALLLGYILRPHPYYRSAYSYGHYPSYYSPRRTVTRTTTRTVNNSRPATNNRTYSNSNSTKPTYNNSASNNSYNNRASLSTPSKSQRSFEVRDNSKPVSASGFGNKSTTPSSRSYGSSNSSSFGSSKPSYSSSPSSSSRSYGSSKSSSFGSSSPSKSSSFGSSKSSSFGSSRSSSFGKKR